MYGYIYIYHHQQDNPSGVAQQPYSMTKPISIINLCSKLTKKLIEGLHLRVRYYIFRLPYLLKIDGIFYAGGAARSGMYIRIPYSADIYIS